MERSNGPQTRFQVQDLPNASTGCFGLHTGGILHQLWRLPVPGSGVRCSQQPRQWGTLHGQNNPFQSSHLANEAIQVARDRAECWNAPPAGLPGPHRPC